MKQTELVIVGGGILGAGVAQAAIAGRFKVILLESNSVGSATSCNSSKLIHGGLRYLESAQLGLVRDSLKERKKLFDIANHLVKPINFYIPIYQKSKRSGWVITLGLFLYYVLSGFSKWGRFKIIPKKHWGKIKGIKKSGLKMILQYWDGQTDDRKLCEEVAQSARSLGADIIENAKCTSIIKKDEGYTVR
ncbi:MAG: FAD-dependent oxidoreductase, partial [Shewanella sp.]|nr:FAD-dependent oxidoreductase [Shewanella sp.]